MVPGDDAVTCGFVSLLPCSDGLPVAEDLGDYCGGEVMC